MLSVQTSQGSRADKSHQMTLLECKLSFLTAALLNNCAPSQTAAEIRTKKKKPYKNLIKHEVEEQGDFFPPIVYIQRYLLLSLRSLKLKCLRVHLPL